jgi:hypothetical protein
MHVYIFFGTKAWANFQDIPLFLCVSVSGFIPLRVSCRVCVSAPGLACGCLCRCLSPVVLFFVSRYVSVLFPSVCYVHTGRTHT